MARDGVVWCSDIVKQILNNQIWWSAAMATSPAKPKTACAEKQGNSMQASTPASKKRGSEDSLIASDIKAARSSRLRLASPTGPTDAGDQRCANLPPEPPGDIRAPVRPSRRVRDGSAHRHSCG